MRILYVVNSAKFFLSHRLPLARASNASGYDVHVCVPAPVDDENVTKTGLPIHYYDLARRSMKPWTELQTTLSLTRVYRRLRPDLVHHVTIKAAVHGTLAARLTGVPAAVNAITGLGSVFVASGRLAAARRQVVLASLRGSLRHENSRLILQNPDDLKCLVDARVVSHRNAILIRGSGVDMERFAPTPEPEGIPTVLFCARMLRDKGVADFVDAATILKRDGLAARFVLCGDPDPGNPSAIPLNQMEQWAATGLVEWWRHRSDMPTVLAESNIVCLPSRYGEGVPKVLIEAAAAGRAIVATDVPGCREIVKNGINGLLVPPGSPAALSHALATYILNSDIRAEAGRRGREIADPDFSLTFVNDSTLAVYDELLGRRYSN